MEDQVRLLAVNNISQERMGDIHLMENRGWVQVLRFAGAQVVDHYHSVIQCQQSVDQIGTNKPSGVGEWCRVTVGRGFLFPPPSCRGLREAKLLCYGMFSTFGIK